MQAKIVTTRIVHRVQFAPDPRNKSFPTPPRVVETRYVRDLDQIPEGVYHICFDDVVETTVQVGDRTEKVQSAPFNESTYSVSINDGSDWCNRQYYREIEIHPNLKGKIWVFCRIHQTEDEQVA